MGAGSSKILAEEYVEDGGDGTFFDALGWSYRRVTGWTRQTAIGVVKDGVEDVSYVAGDIIGDVASNLLSQPAVLIGGGLVVLLLLKR